MTAEQPRLMSTSARGFDTNQTIRFSEGTDAAASRTELALLAGRWRLTSSGDGLEATFKFKTFAKSWDFMTAVALQCKIANHHPEWSNTYNTTYIRWTTHNPKGLSDLDIRLAKKCDEIAAQMGLKDDGPMEAVAHQDLQDLACTVSSSAGDCCTPKPKQ